MKKLSVKEIEEIIDEVDKKGYAVAKHYLMKAIQEKADETIVAELDFMGMHKLIKISDCVPFEYRITLPGHEFELDENCNNVCTDKYITLIFRKERGVFGKVRHRYVYDNFI